MESMSTAASSPRSSICSICDDSDWEVCSICDDSEWENNWEWEDNDAALTLFSCMSPRKRAQTCNGKHLPGNNPTYASRVTLCSCPVKQFDEVKAICQTFRIFVAAGTADDLLHKHILMQPKSCLAKALGQVLARVTGLRMWMNPWLSKTANRIENVFTLHPGPHVLVCIAGGGLACDWEREQILGDGFVRKLCGSYSLHVKVCEDADDFRYFLTSGAPISECKAVA